MTLKMTVVAPIPSASAKIANRANPRSFFMPRAKRKSCQNQLSLSMRFPCYTKVRVGRARRFQELLQLRHMMRVETPEMQLRFLSYGSGG